ncbi:methyltransferase [Nitratireductor sp. B36]|uniref:methyltransferase domain-containing protein n=1 Tax=Nitratireductor sp. B36 TaxID=2762059 RepID=UPI001E595E09|nr:methyltransferase domain-containing protein [Nitratireductor sp. B36]MCC5778138.1 methyltransferase [Nitratireductor sp. B36]
MSDPASENAAANAVDEEALAEAYNRALALEKAGDFDAAAEAYREVLALDPADHGGAAVRLASMGRGETPSRASEAYVATLFDQHAGAFESILVDQLGYDVPALTRRALDEVAPGPFRRMLDLGCGTGLAGEVLRDIADHITGVDLSETMIEVTDEKELYDALYVGDAVDFLHHADVEPFDLITATDVLPYLGDLEAFFAGAAELATDGAVLAFSSETLPDEVLAGRAFMVGPHQRFAHSESYLAEMLAGHGFTGLAIAYIVVRHEMGKPVPGHLVVARRKPAD